MVQVRLARRNCQKRQKADHDKTDVRAVAIKRSLRGAPGCPYDAPPVEPGTVPAFPKSKQPLIRFAIGGGFALR
jgi:hypothetical protein